MTQSWARSMPRVVAEVVCSGTIHQVVWNRGSLVFLHHDLDAERAMEGLGGEPPECLIVYRAWTDICTADRPLQAFDSPIGPRGRSAGPLPNVLRRYLESLPTGLRDVAAVAAVVRAQRRDRSRRGEVLTRVPPLLQRRMSERVSAALLASLEPARAEGARQRVEFSLRVVPVGESPSVEGEITSRRIQLRLSLSPTWLVEVERLGFPIENGTMLLACRGQRAAGFCWEHDGGALRPRLAFGRCLRTEGGWSFTEAQVPPLDLWWSIKSA
ncbi:MAG: hypothetical protein ACI8Y4_000294 [Candidatus Poriferisodalaceae bacterium]|jgi:hypothetical protein